MATDYEIFRIGLDSVLQQNTLWAVGTFDYAKLSAKGLRLYHEGRALGYRLLACAEGAFIDLGGYDKGQRTNENT